MKKLWSAPALNSRETGEVIDSAAQERFWRRVQKGAPNACWLWTGSQFLGGYGRFKVGSRSMYASRAALVIATGIEPADRFCLHSCDNPPCCNPAHLRWGTPAENAEDAAKRGRHYRLNGQHVGEGNPRSKLTVSDVLEIKASSHTPIKSLATKYGVSATTISNIRAGVRWSHVA